MGRRHVVVAMFVALAAAGGVAGLRTLQAPPTLLAIAPSERAAVSPSTTSGDGLSQALATLTARVAANTADDQAAVALADVLMRQARVTGDGSLPRRAEVALTDTIAATDSYLGRRMLGAVYLAQHRFLAALEAGRRAQRIRPDDSWNYGVIGDAAIELGRYDEAFAPSIAWRSLKPTAAAYARIAYARELQGNLDGAVTAMRMAIESTSPQDPEGIAWAWSQLGALHAAEGRDRPGVDGLRPGALRVSAIIRTRWVGQATVAVVAWRLRSRTGHLSRTTRAAPTPELAAQVGDLLHRARRRRGRPGRWAEAERLEREGWKARVAAAGGARAPSGRAQPAATGSRAPGAEGGAGARRHLHERRAGLVALSHGALEEAWAASERARRTGTRDRRILYHAAAIAAARGDTATARTLADARARRASGVRLDCGAGGEERCWRNCSDALRPAQPRWRDGTRGAMTR